MFLKNESVLRVKGERKSLTGLLAQPVPRRVEEDWSWGFLEHTAKSYGCNCFFCKWDIFSQHHSLSGRWFYLGQILFCLGKSL